MTLHLEVVTPKGVIVESDVQEVSVPGVLGEMGILEGHIPVLTAIKAGLLRYRAENKDHFIAIGGRGYVEITGQDKVLVIVDNSLNANEVDGALAKEELSHAEKELNAFVGKDDDPARQDLIEKMQWAQTQIELAEKN